MANIPSKKPEEPTPETPVIEEVPSEEPVPDVEPEPVKVEEDTVEEGLPSVTELKEKGAELKQKGLEASLAPVKTAIGSYYRRALGVADGVLDALISDRPSKKKDK